MHCYFWDPIASSENKIQYVVNEEKRTVVAYMSGCSYDAISTLSKMGISSISHPSFRMKKFLMNDVYRGKAKCAPEDEWDEEEGKTIARNRMLQNYYVARFNAFARASDSFETIFSELTERMDYADIKIMKAAKELL